MPSSIVSRVRDSVASLLLKANPIKVPVPPSPSVLLANDRATYHIQRPKDTRQDSPLGTLYRIYWAIVMDDTISMRNEIEYFWDRKEESWKVHNIPRPPDQDPQRFAVISAIPFALVAAFNRLIDLGLPRSANAIIYSSEMLEQLAKKSKVLEQVPQWAECASPLSEPLRLPTHGLGTPQTASDEGADPFMALKNVLVWRLHINFT